MYLPEVKKLSLLKEEETISTDHTMIQPSDIENILQKKYEPMKINDDLGFTGEWRLDVKDLLDIIIDLRAKEEESLRHEIDQQHMFAQMRQDGEYDEDYDDE